MSLNLKVHFSLPPPTELTLPATSSNGGTGFQSLVGFGPEERSWVLGFHLLPDRLSPLHKHYLRPAEGRKLTKDLEHV